jgi:hypothetical protein
MAGRKWTTSVVREIGKLRSRRAQSRSDTDCYMQGNLKIPAPRLAFLQANSSRHFVYGW